MALSRALAFAHSYEIGTRWFLLVPDWYQNFTTLVTDWHHIGTRSVPDWSEIGARFVPDWYQIGTTLVPDVPNWYQIAPTRLEHALVDDFPQTSRKLPKGFPEGVPRASQGFSKVLMGLETS